MQHLFAGVSAGGVSSGAARHRRGRKTLASPADDALKASVLLDFDCDRYVFHAARLGRAIVDLPATSGFREYFDPETGAGYGAEDFSWMAALLSDLLHDDLYP